MSKEDSLVRLHRDVMDLLRPEYAEGSMSRKELSEEIIRLRKSRNSHTRQLIDTFERRVQE